MDHQPVQTSSQLEDEKTGLVGLGVPIEWIKEMRAQSNLARADLRESCNHLNLLTLETRDDITDFEAAIVTFSNAAHAWAWKCAKDCIGFYGKNNPGKAIPAFTICKMGTFGRLEMSPYSDSDILFLCAPENVKILEDGFAKFFSTVTASLYRSTPGGTFCVSCDAREIVTTQSQQVQSLGKFNDAIPDVFTLYSYPNEGNTFVREMYAQRAVFVEPLKERVAKNGLDALFNSGHFSNYYFRCALCTFYNVKAITACFQRGLAILSAARGDTNADAKYLHGATSERIQTYMAEKGAAPGSKPRAWTLYYQVLAVRYAMHFRKTKEDDTVDAGHDGDIYARIEQLNNSGLRDVVGSINLMLMALR